MSIKVEIILYNMVMDLDNLLDNLIEKYIKSNKIVRMLQRKIILKKFLTLLAMLTVWTALLMGAWFSPTRVTYTDDQLATERTYANNTGQVTLTSQSYDKETGIVLLQFETTDYTSVVNKGIDPKKLSWQIFTKSGSAGVNMQIIPLTNNKIAVVIKEVPEKFEALAVNIYNETTSTGEVDISIKDYEEATASSSSTETSDSDEEADVGNKMVQFIVTTQSENLKKAQLKNLSREEFALQIFTDELTFQQEQIKRLNESIKKLESAITEDQDTMQTLQREAQYLVGSKLQKKQDSIEKVESSIADKKSNIEAAKENIATVQSIVDNLNTSIQAVKDGTYEFNAPVTSVEMNF